MAGILAVSVLLVAAVRAEDQAEIPGLKVGKSLTLSGFTRLLAVAWEEGTDNPSVRRARLALGGELLTNLRFRVGVDLVKSPVRLDELVEWAPSDAVGLRLGRFLVPFSLENATPVTAMDRGLPGDGKNFLTFGLNWFLAGKTKLQVNAEIHRLESGVRENSALLAPFQAAF